MKVHPRLDCAGRKLFLVELSGDDWYWLWPFRDGAKWRVVKDTVDTEEYPRYYVQIHSRGTYSCSCQGARKVKTCRHIRMIENIRGKNYDFKEPC